MPTSIDPPAAVSLPPDYLERVYAGVLGKNIGVYLGRPFEGWSHQRIMAELGHITDYVNDKLGVPLVVTDDDVSGTYAFVRALEEHTDLSSEAIGKTWLNNVVEKSSVFWWGGRGISTEHTAFLNLKQGIPAPASGSIAVNGKTVAEQIGAQIFIDGWAMVAPGQPALAAQLADAAGKVSHDGESVYAAIVWAVMESEAFVSKDINHLIDTGLSFIPTDSLIARVIADVRAWVKEDGDWLKTRQRIEDVYGYDKFFGNCHVVPNHAIMIMSVLYSPDNFSRAMEIVNTCGWDTDCNSGNVGCLMAIMLGMDAFAEGGTDWRGSVSDRAIISSADNGYSINNAARVALDIVNIGRRLAGKSPIPQPKNAQFHFTLPGSTQGFRVLNSAGGSVRQDVDPKHGPALVVQLDTKPVEVTTPISAPLEYLKMPDVYPLCSSPLVYPGQRLRATLRSDATLTAPVEVRFRLQVFNCANELVPIDSDASVVLTPGDDNLQTLEWTIPRVDGGYPIGEAGIVAAAGKGRIWLDSLEWSGQPDLELVRPSTPTPHTFFDLAWIQSVDTWTAWPGQSTVQIASDYDEGVVTYGTRDWTDYRVTVDDFFVRQGAPAGVLIRARGLRRWYALLFTRNGDHKTLSIVKAVDERRIELAKVDYDWSLDEKLQVVFEANGSTLTGRVGNVTLTATDDQWKGGALGFHVNKSSLSAGRIRVQPSAVA